MHTSQKAGSRPDAEGVRSSFHKLIVPLHVSSAPASEYVQGNTTRHAHLHDGISKNRGSLPAYLSPHPMKIGRFLDGSAHLKDGFPRGCDHLPALLGI